MPERASEPLFTSAGDVREGDTIEWCGRFVEVIAISHARTKRPGVYFTISDAYGARRLHYFTDEEVRHA